MGITQTPAIPARAISEDKRTFFIELGQRIAQRRKALDITQTQLAKLLGISQQAMNSFEKGRRRVPASALPAIARAVGASLDELVFDDDERAPDADLRLQFEALSQFSAEEKKIARAVIDGLILKHDAQRFVRTEEAR